jgi:hypothetical protein
VQKTVLQSVPKMVPQMVRWLALQKVQWWAPQTVLKSAQWLALLMESQTALWWAEW